MSVLPDFAHHRPASVEEALGLVSFDSVPYSGGTELLLAMRAGLLRPKALIDLKRIDGLGSVEFHNDHIEIGAGVSHKTALENPHIQREVPVLADMLAKVGNPRVRAAGTLAGNLCFAEPKSDVATLLDALEGEVDLRSVDGVRTVPVSEFIAGPYTTLREDREILTSIRVPVRDGRPAAYAKFQTMERPTAGVAAAITSQGRFRLVVGAVGGMPEAFETDDPSGIDPTEIAGAVEVIPDMTGSETYKRHIVSVYILNVLNRLEAAA